MGTRKARKMGKNKEDKCKSSSKAELGKGIEKVF